MKCLRAFCSEQIVLFDLEYVVEVLESEDFSFTELKQGRAKYLEQSVYRECFAQVLWRDQQIDFIDLNKLINFKQASLKSSSVLEKLQAQDVHTQVQKFIVTAPQHEILQGVYEHAVMFAVSELHDIVDMLDLAESNQLNFQVTSLASLISQATYSESLNKVQLYMNLPMNVSHLIEHLSLQAA